MADDGWDDDDDHVPPDFACPITQELMEDPVICNDGMTYERSEIEEWFRRGNRTSPKTNAVLQSLAVVPNHSLRGAIDAWREEQPRVAGRLEELRRANRLLASRPAEAPTSIPARFFDPFLPSLMVDPVRAEDGFDYNRACLTHWIADAQRTNRPLVSPRTRKPMGASFEESGELKSEILAFIKSRFPQDDDDDGNAGDDAIDDAVQAPVVPQFGSVQDLNKLFAVLDGLDDVLREVLHGWEPPRVVAIGSENAGKSTMLERLCMLSLFPHDYRLCTRMPIRVNIRRGPSKQPPTIETWDVRQNCRVGDPEVIPLVNGDVDIKDAMLRAILDEGIPGERRVSEAREIRVHIVSPSLPPMNLIDLPGIVSNPKQDAARTRRLVARHMANSGDQCLYLAMVPVSEGPRSSEAVSLVVAAGLESRTIGVITKCDKLDDFRKLTS